MSNTSYDTVSKLEQDAYDMQEDSRKTEERAADMEDELKEYLKSLQGSC